MRGKGRRISQSSYMRSYLPQSSFFAAAPLHCPPLPCGPCPWDQNLTWAPVDPSVTTAVVLHFPPIPFDIPARKLELHLSHYHLYPCPKPGSQPTSCSGAFPGNALPEAAPISMFCNQSRESTAPSPPYQKSIRGFRASQDRPGPPQVQPPRKHHHSNPSS